MFVSTRKIIYIAMFSAIGIVLPQAFHLFGSQTAGQMFLPIHLPVFIGAMLLGPLAGIIIAFVSLSVGVLLGMPPLLFAYFMFFEMVTYAAVTGLVYYKLQWNVYVSLLLGKISGMLMALIVINIALALFTLAVPPTYGSLLMFSIGIPGIIIQFIVVPIVVIRLQGVIDHDA